MKVSGLFVLTAIFLICGILSAANARNDISLPFIENSGQHPYGVLFSVSVPGGNAVLTYDAKIVDRKSVV